MDVVTERALRLDGYDDGDDRRIEVITGAPRRRRWSADEKAAVVAESFRPGVNVSALSRRTGVNRGLLQTWRRAAVRAASDREAPAFVPIHVESARSDGGTSSVTDPPTQGRATATAETCPGMIEIESDDLRVRVQGSVDMRALQAVLSRVGRRR
jgi:transposase